MNMNNDTMFDNLDIVEGVPSKPRISETVESLLALKAALDEGYLNEVDIEKLRQPTIDMLFYLADNVDVVNLSSGTAELVRVVEAIQTINEAFCFGEDDQEGEF